MLLLQIYFKVTKKIMITVEGDHDLDDNARV